MRTLIVYGTVEGQTRKIADAVKAHLQEAGEEVVLVDTSERTGTMSFDGVDRVILAASVHERRHPKPFEVFVASSRDDLSRRPMLFLSVSLKAAFADGREEAQEYVDEMKLRTGLNPTMELLVPGAIRSESYDFYAAQVLRHVVLAGQDVDPSARDHEFTDWDALKAAVTRFLTDTATAKEPETGH
ncbi:flavodoxin domain-containing protein [uncultured Tateyamaria sp.]|uniref:flavodoxin domain-containing protein n=1 Tax=uncultured Tateyamaria sp. TaxID=455651 RepID=UPI00260B22C1|nr:flavodoxin domain-containing protein [uncultured Tateyamaria sp.]